MAVSLAPNQCTVGSSSLASFFLSVAEPWSSIMALVRLCRPMYSCSIILQSDFSRAPAPGASAAFCALASLVAFSSSSFSMLSHSVIAASVALRQGHNAWCAKRFRPRQGPTSGAGDAVMPGGRSLAATAPAGDPDILHDGQAEAVCSPIARRTPASLV